MLTLLYRKFFHENDILFQLRMFRCQNGCKAVIAVLQGKSTKSCFKYHTTASIQLAPSEVARPFQPADGQSSA